MNANVLGLLVVLTVMVPMLLVVTWRYQLVDSEEVPVAVAVALPSVLPRARPRKVDHVGWLHILGPPRERWQRPLDPRANVGSDRWTPVRTLAVTLGPPRERCAATVGPPRERW